MLTIDPNLQRDIQVEKFLTWRFQIYHLQGFEQISISSILGVEKRDHDPYDRS